MSEKNELGQFIPLHYHFNMLLDPARMGAFKTAIGKAVHENAVVLELGGGTGVLSFFAAQKARKVYCVEYNPELAQAASQFLADNPNGNRVTVVNTDATTYTPPEEIDVVICEMLHVALLREKQLEVIEAFKQNYLKARGGPLPLFIPFATMQAVQPVHHPFEFFGYRARVPMFNDPYAQAPDITELGAPVLYHQLLYNETYSQHISWQGKILVTQPGKVNALRFITKNLLNADAHTQEITDWHNQYLICPIDNDIDVKNGDVLEVTFAYDSGAPLNTLKPTVRLTEG
jgi:predicted RNA methylase